MTNKRSMLLAGVAAVSRGCSRPEVRGRCDLGVVRCLDVDQPHQLPSRGRSSSDIRRRARGGGLRRCSGTLDWISDDDDVCTFR
jgi:hypothetical protein